MSDDAARERKAEWRRSKGVIVKPRRIDNTEPRPWAVKANCLGMDPELFHPERGQGTRDAKEVCAGCAVCRECLDYAIAHHESFGIWGGTSERERRKLRRAAS